MFVSLAACGGSSESGFTGVDHSNRPTSDPIDTSKTPDTTKPPETTQPLNWNNAVIGTWIYGSAKSDWPYEEWTKKNFLYGIAAGLYTFKADGTYFYQFRSYTEYSDDYFQQQGKYRVEDNKIILCDRTENHIDFDFPKENYENKQLSEKTYYYQFTQMSNGTEAINIETSIEALNSDIIPSWKWERAK